MIEQENRVSFWSRARMTRPFVTTVRTSGDPCERINMHAGRRQHVFGVIAHGRRLQTPGNAGTKPRLYRESEKERARVDTSAPVPCVSQNPSSPAGSAKTEHSYVKPVAEHSEARGFAKTHVSGHPNAASDLRLV